MPLVFTLLLAGCGGGDLTLRDTFDTAPKDTTDTTSVTDTEPPDPGPQNCIWTGTWTFTNARCGEDGFNEWEQMYDSTSLVITHNLDEGCDVLFTRANGQCTEAATWYVFPAAEDTTVEFGQPPGYAGGAPFGVTSCEPDACQFSGGTAACELGAHKEVQTVLVDQTVAGTLAFTFLASYAAPTCDDALRLIFTNEAG